MSSKKVKTMDFKGRQYAQVKDRLKEFRTANINALIETTPTVQEDGRVIFKARILADKSNPNSAEATGHALSSKAGEKEFEKLETIAVGRALALLGYASDGEIASSDEMEEFLEYQQTKHQQMILDETAKLTATKNIEELKAVWAKVPAAAKIELNDLKDNLKARHEGGNISGPRRVARRSSREDNGQ